MNLLAYWEFLNLFVNSITIRGSISTQITCFALYKSNSVKFPVPGPISNTISVGLTAALSTIDWRTYGLTKICYPKLLLKTMLVFATVLLFILKLNYII